MNRYVLEVLIRKELIEQPYPPKGLRFVETGDTVAEASYNGEVNATFRVSGFSVRHDGTWSDYAWEDVQKPLPPPLFDPRIGPTNHQSLRVELTGDRIIAFEMDHFWGYHSLFSSAVRWLKTGSDADWWKRLEVRKWRPPNPPALPE